MIAVFMASLAHYLLVPACGPVIDGASDVQAPLTISLYAPIYRPRQQHVRANTLHTCVSYATVQCITYVQHNTTICMCIIHV